MKKKRNLFVYIIPFYLIYLNRQLLKAVETHNISLARKLLEKGADPDYAGIRGNWPVLLAALENREVMELLLDYGADINCCDGGKCYSPLIRAARAGDFLLTRFLLEKGADPYVVSFCGLVPLVYAVERGNKEVVKILVSSMSDIQVLEECMEVCYKRHIPHPVLLAFIRKRIRFLKNKSL